MRKFRKRFRKRGRQTIVCLLAFLMALSLVIGGSGSIVRAEASANSITSTFISWAAGKQLTDVDINNLDLSQKDLQFLGVYISNFFVPFGTELGEPSEEDEELTNGNKEDIKKALQTNLSFSDTLADTLTETLLGLSRSSIKELTLYVSKDYQEDLVEVPDMPLNTYTAYTAMLGGLETIAGWYGDGANDVIKGIVNGTYKWGYFGYTKNGVVRPVFDFNIKMDELTPSASAFIKCLESADLKNGYGFNFFDFTSDELDNSQSAFKEAISKLTEDQASSMSMYGSKLAVDCFGNIIFMGENHQFIGVPGAMNPYTWVTVDSNGSEVGSGYGGTAYNMINLPSMSMYDAKDQSGKTKLFSNISNSDNGGNTVGGGTSGVDQNLEFTLGGKLGPGESWLDTIGGEDKFLNSGLIGGNRLKEYLEFLIDFSGDTKVSSVDFSLTARNSSIYISGLATVLSEIDSSRITEDFLSKATTNQTDANKVREYLSKLEKNYGITVDDMREVLDGIDTMASESLLNSSNSSNGSSNGTVNMVRQATVDTSVLASKLKDMQQVGSSMGSFLLRKLRGDSDYGFNNSSWWGIADLGGSSFRDLAKMAESGYTASHGDKALNYYNSANGGIGGGSTISIYGKKIDGDTLSAKSTIDVLDSFIYIDDLGAYHFDSSDEEVGEFSTTNVLHYISDDSMLADVRESMKLYNDSNGFTNTYANIESGRMSIPTNIKKEAMVGIYITYAYASLYADSGMAKADTIGALGYKMNATGLPEIPNEALILSDTATEDSMLTSIRDWLYYLMHPTEGIDYFRTWITNKLNGFLVGWHDDMVGTRGTGSINGTTKYRGFSGYVTTPELTDLPWTDSLLDLYNMSIPFLLVFMIVVMLGAYIVGILTLQKSVIGVTIFAICVTIPPIAVNGLVGFSNRFSSSLYGEKFTYWALVQHESYATLIDSVASGDSYSNYLKTLYATNSESKGNQGGESIMLKWQTPKKMASLMFDDDSSSVLDTDNSLLSGLLESTYSGESYLDTDSVYLYRSYIDIANFSRYIHRGLTQGVQSINQNLTSDIKSTWDDSLKEAVSNFSANYEKDRVLGYTNRNADGSTSGNKDSIIRVRLPLASGIVSEALSMRGKIAEMDLDDYVGINQDAFNFSIPMFNTGSDYWDDLKSDNFTPSDYPREDYSALAAYGLMSENSFYYFSWYLYEVGLTESTNTNTGYKNLLLGEDNAGFFYNTSGNGELKDFMDMRSLFTYIIPYLRMCNDLVEEWDDTYGIFFYEGVPTEEGHQDDTDIASDPELRQKYWHNLNVARLYNMYTPWVDIMYDCSYAKAEKISYLGESYVVADPLNPSSYPEERPMIFSKSEMVDYGLTSKDLTKVEKLIIECQEGMEERLFNLLNYHTFSDVVLNTAAAMNCAFEFNETFSENSLFGANNNIYPQSFELADFSYDAFLRFILSNSTGESMLVDEGESFYQNIVNNSSMTTIIVMLILDVLAMYVVPGLKIFFIIGVFLMGVLIILMSAFKVDSENKFVNRLMVSFLKPMFKFMVITCLMSWIVSLFMGEGHTGVTGSMGPSISLGDPTMAMLAMIVLNLGVVYLYAKMLVDVWKDIKRSGKLVGNFITGVFGSMAGFATSALAGKGLGSFGGGSSSGGYARGGNDRENLGEANSRAKSRGSNVTIIQSSEVRNQEESSSDRDHSRNSSIDFNTEGGSKSSDDIERKTNSGMKNINSNLSKDKE